MTYEEAKARSASLDAEVARTGATLRALSGERGPMGLTPDVVKARPEWRAAKLAADTAFAKLRAFNGPYVKRFAREIRADCDARRARKQVDYGNACP